eukprot:619046-Amphidinium_carterae.1
MSSYRVRFQDLDMRILERDSSGNTDDVIAVTRGPSLTDGVLEHIKQTWSVSYPEALGKNGIKELNLIGIRVQMDGVGGLFIHQSPFAVELTTRYPQNTKKRDTPRDPLHYVKRSRKDPMKLGGLLWLSTKTRVDLAWLPSVA